MIKHWEEFAYKSQDELNNLHITLNRKGEIMLGAAACEKLGRPSRAMLMFDRVNSLIGVRPASTVEKDGHPLVTKTGGRHLIIRANRFCRKYSITVPRTIAFETAEIDDEGILILNLKNTIPAGRK